MPITHRATVGEMIAFDPGDARGPWTFETPQNPQNGDWFTLKALTFDHTQIIIDTLVSQIYEQSLEVR